MEDFLKFIADIMEVPIEIIDLSTSQNDLIEWDSLMQLRLLSEIESKYKVSIPYEDVSKIKTLEGFYQYIK
ncbi:MAG: acyl carrier protein [Mobilitalea sp.]